MVLKTLEKSLLLRIFIFSVITKLVLLFILGYQTFMDGVFYINIAEKIWSNNLIFPSDILKDAPFTPYFYALFYPLVDLIGINALAIGNILLSSLTIIVGYKISKELFNETKIANITAIIFAIYPFFNFYAIAILTETVYIFFLYISFLYAIRFIKRFQTKDLALFSFFFAIDTLIRFANLSMFIFFILLFIFLLKRCGKENIFVVKAVLIASFVFSLTMTPWWIRNYSVHGEFVATSVGESGKVFYSGNNPLNKSGGGIGGVDVDTTPFKHITDPKERDAAMWQAGIKWIQENPDDWIALEFKKLFRFFSPVFYAKQYDRWYYNIVSVMSYGVVFVLFLYGIYRFREKWPLYSPMLLYAVLLTGIHLVFIASIRYRLPIEPFMIILAAPVILKIVDKYAKTN